MIFRVPRIAGRPPVGVGAKTAKSEFDGVGLAGDDAELAADGAHHRAFGFIVGWQLPGRTGKDRIAFDPINIFDRNRNALQPAETVAGFKGAVGGLRLLSNLAGVPGFIGFQLGVPLIMAVNDLFIEFDCRKLAVFKGDGERR